MIYFERYISVVTPLVTIIRNLQSVFFLNIFYCQKQTNDPLGTESEIRKQAENDAFLITPIRISRGLLCFLPADIKQNTLK